MILPEGRDMNCGIIRVNKNDNGGGISAAPILLELRILILSTGFVRNERFSLFADFISV